jgi:hypothetical protein
MPEHNWGSGEKLFSVSVQMSSGNGKCGRKNIWVNILYSEFFCIRLSTGLSPSWEQNSWKYLYCCVEA